MTTEQQAAYDGAEEIGSDPFGVLDRDNRNHRKKRRLIVDALDVGPDAHVLEVGCGGGLHAEQYAEAFDEFTAVDLSASLCDQTRSRAPDSTVLQADARRLPFPDDAVDAVVGAAVLHHLPDIQRALAEWLRVARESVTVMEPNVLFPKDLATAYLLPEERHKTQMVPWNVRAVFDALETSHGVQTAVEPCIHTPPWPGALIDLWDRVDSVARSVPGVRWLGQMVFLRLTH
jgi:ubiquinone/menaquinone biosynthesis C-methylase UbiE